MAISGIGTSGSIVPDTTGAASSAGTAKDNAADKAFATALQSAYDDQDKKKLKEVCHQFESIMMSMMYKQMKATIPTDETSGNSQAKDIYQGMLDDELMNRSGERGIGLADILYKQLSKRMDSIVKVGGESGAVDAAGGVGAGAVEAVTGSQDETVESHKGAEATDGSGATESAGTP